MSPASRICTKCNVCKPLDEFSAAPRGKYGRKASCKACDAARHAALHPPKPREWRPLREPFTGDEMKTCTKCGETKRLGDNFSLSKRATATTNAVYKPICKPCSSAQAIQWFRDNPERVAAASHRANLRVYGLTPDDYAALLAAQGCRCAICGLDEPNAHGRTGKKFRLSVDHCHGTGRIRGLLCQKCNRAIGLLGDSVELLRKAIDYLERE